MRCVVQALLLLGCSASTSDLFVDLRTDLLPGDEFRTVRIFVIGGEFQEQSRSHTVDTDLSSAQPQTYLDGVRGAKVVALRRARTPCDWD